VRLRFRPRWNTASTGVIFTGDLRLYRDDGLPPVVASTTGGGSITLYAGKVYTVAVGSGVTAQDKTDIISGVWNATLASYQSAGSTGEALDDAAAGGGGGGGGGGGSLTAADVWTYGTRTLTASADPTASQVATAVRTELATELARVDVATSTRLSSAGYTAPPAAATNATAVRTELAAELLRIIQLAYVHGLVGGSPLQVSATQRQAGTIVQQIAEAAGTVTVERVA
jgi:hypothetical protein